MKKYLVNLNLPEDTFNNLFLPGRQILVQGEKLIIRASDNSGNDAGFGWNWAYNPGTSSYRYKVSIFDGRVISKDTIVPDVGITNIKAYNALQKTLIEKDGFLFSWKNFIKIVKWIFT